MCYWVSVLPLFLTVFEFVIVAGEVKYKAAYRDDVRECEDVEKQGLDFSKIKVVQESGSDGYLTGEVTINEDIHEGAQVKAEITHEVDGAYEYVCALVGDVCEELQNEDTPWYPLFNGMGITECPIKKGKYNMDKVALDISNYNEYLDTEYCGDYIATISLLDAPEEDSLDPDALVPKVFSCHELSATVFELTDDK